MVKFYDISWIFSISQNFICSDDIKILLLMGFNNISWKLFLKQTNDILLQHLLKYKFIGTNNDYLLIVKSLQSTICTICYNITVNYNIVSRHRMCIDCCEKSELLEILWPCFVNPTIIIDDNSCIKTLEQIVHIAKPAATILIKNDFIENEPFRSKKHIFMKPIRLIGDCKNGNIKPAIILDKSTLVFRNSFCIKNLDIVSGNNYLGTDIHPLNAYPAIQFSPYIKYKEHIPCIILGFIDNCRISATCGTGFLVQYNDTLKTAVEPLISVTNTVFAQARYAGICLDDKYNNNKFKNNILHNNIFLDVRAWILQVPEHFEKFMDPTLLIENESIDGSWKYSSRTGWIII
jgi:hypothetical protein